MSAIQFYLQQFNTHERTELAEEINITPNYIHRCRSGNASPSITLFALMLNSDFNKGLDKPLRLTVKQYTAFRMEKATKKMKL